MSSVRKHFCRVVSSGAGGCSRPRKNGISGCIPAVVSSVERSSARGTSEADGLNAWPFDSKKERKPARSSADVRILGLYERCSAGLGPGGIERTWTCPSPASASLTTTIVPESPGFCCGCGAIVTLSARTPCPTGTPRRVRPLPDRRSGSTPGGLRLYFLFARDLLADLLQRAADQTRHVH